MKTTKYFLMGLAALAMTACNKNDEPVANEGNATVSVRVVGSSMRATGDALDNESDIKNLVAIVFNSDGSQDGLGESAIDPKQSEGTITPEVKDIKCTAGANKKIVVVANIPSSKFVGKKYEEVRKLTFELLEEQPKMQKHLAMSGEVEGVKLESGHNYYGFGAGSHSGAGNTEINPGEPLQLKRIAARVTLTGTTVEFGDAYENFELKWGKDDKEEGKDDKEEGKDNATVMLNLVPEQSFIIGESLYDPTSSYLYGKGITPTANPGTNNWLDGLTIPGKYKESELLSETPYSKGKANFYALENTDKKHQTMLVLKVKLVTKGKNTLEENEKAIATANKWIDAEGYTYYPILINHFNDTNYKGEKGTKTDVIERNTIYKLDGLKLTRPGVKDPNEKVDETVLLDVNCTVAEWSLVTQNVEW